ncbi:hypothetical protein DDD63_08460 [Actinobaculum sp. 313]|nr:hypothetical protein DDD63_08460 [Actinobaculum sp. 313]
MRRCSGPRQAVLGEPSRRFVCWELPKFYALRVKNWRSGWKVRWIKPRRHTLLYLTRFPLVTAVSYVCVPVNISLRIRQRGHEHVADNGDLDAVPEDRAAKVDGPGEGAVGVDEELASNAEEFAGAADRADTGTEEASLADDAEGDVDGQNDAEDDTPVAPANDTEESGDDDARGVGGPITGRASVADVTERLEKLGLAVEAGGECIDPFLAARVRKELLGAQERLGAGIGLTVAALAGGTGSGKSTLFNALTELDFADAGEIRPTTEQATACVWNADATKLLDMLGVSPNRRINHESILTAGRDSMDGLVLLDLPDHDSIAVGHSMMVDRLLPMVDVLVWILDPQKYADHLIHESYLAAMRARKDHMIVVLNQVDTIPPAGYDALVADVIRLLEEDGLEGVPVHAASALNHEGLEPIRQALRDAVQTTEAGIATAQAELDAIRRRLAVSVGDGEAELDGEVVEATNEQIVSACGIPAVVESLRQAGRTLGQSAIAKPERPAASMVVAARDAWLSHVRTGLPARWQDAVAEAIPDPDRVRRAIALALRGVPVPAVSRKPTIVLGVLGSLLAVVGIVLAIIGVPVRVLPARIALAVGGLALGAVLWVVGLRMQATAGVRSAEQYEAAATQAIAQSTKETLVETAASVLDRHRLAREALEV